MTERQVPKTDSEQDFLRSSSLDGAQEEHPDLSNLFETPWSDTRFESAVVPYRPISRPPMAVLCVHDDGSKTTGELIRIRSETFVIGRVEGDLRLGYDKSVSKRHVEIQRVVEDDVFRWYVKDLGSRHGTFFAINRARIRDKQEFLVGKHRLRFEASAARIVNLTSSNQRGEHEVYSITRDSIIIGTHPACDVHINDVMAEPQHARIRKENKRWMIEDVIDGHPSSNGTWLALERTLVGRVARFQAGEQRFTLKLL